MEWKKYSQQIWTHGMKSMMKIPFYIGIPEDDSGVFIVCATYNKRYSIKNYNIYYQNKEHASIGESFVLKIRACSSLDDGRRLAENFYSDFKEGNNPKFEGTQYMSDMTLISGPFIDL